MSNLEEIKERIKRNRKVFYVERGCNGVLKVRDIGEVCKVGKCIGGVSFVDNRFLRGVFQKALEVGG
ncbi:PLP-dependent aspartate aminotransferase family protein, partial [Bacillus thuringiensis]|uniref:PLP-dependent aspartate aminotransferase family protein n=1 Tax=Bacillus thuringiensis TaxID=1428 RepID=UPI0021B64A65